LSRSPLPLDPGAETLFLTGGGELGTRMRQHAWECTALGSARHWPQSLRTAASIVLNSRFPMFIAWGAERALIYNDAYAVILGSKHPDALGQPFERVWREIWTDIAPLVDNALRGEPTFNQNLPLTMDRSGYEEETYFTFSYSPIRDESGQVGGMLCACSETTEQVLAERRLEALTALGAPAATRAGTVAEAQTACIRILGNYTADVPFACLYESLGRNPARLITHSGAPPLLSRDGRAWPLDRATRGEPVLVGGDCDGYQHPHAIVLQVPGRDADELRMTLVLGINPRRACDPDYHEFYQRVAAAVGTAIANARAFELERHRAQTLEELDRAKTAFFSNVSHEFRTPLTLLLGPLDELMDRRLDAGDRSLIELAHRNAARLLRLVNALLDFSRVESGRVDPRFVPTDVGPFTAELASNFRSACEKAGLDLVVDCPALGQPVYLDRGMYEKIVLNLISNAFKYTKQGRIAVRVRARASAGTFELEVADTGCGIPAAELPKVFERFHRIDGHAGRTHEGSGIGLALAQELAQVHGGSVAVTSAPGRGSSFVVSIPLGRTHLAEDRVAESEPRAPTSEVDAFVDEALRWLPDASADSDFTGVHQILDVRGWTDAAADRALILVADDNPDMRDYLRRLLRSRYCVETVADGRAALETLRTTKVDLVVTDAMMPDVDGFELIRTMRADPRLDDTPIIMLSARAGEDDDMDGRTAGADDYLTKPFSARELLVRVEATLDAARVRRRGTAALRESEQRFRQMADSAPVMIWMTESDGVCTYVNKRWSDFTGSPVTGDQAPIDRLDAVHPDDVERVRSELAAANAAQQPIEIEYRLRRTDGEYRWAIDAAAPRRDGEGRFLGHVGSIIDFTDRRNIEQHYRTMAEALPQLVWTALPDGRVSYLSPQWLSYTGLSEQDALGEAWLDAVIHPDDRERTREHWAGTIRGEHVYDLDQRILGVDGVYRWFKTRATPVRNEAGRIVYWFGTCTDIQDVIAARELQIKLRENLEQQVEERTRERDQFWRVSNDVLIVVADIDSRWLTVNPAWEDTLGWKKSELLGSIFERLVHPEDREITVEQMQALKSGQRLWRFENRLMHRDGSYRWISWSAVPDGNRIYGVARDVTPEKQAAAELDEAQQALRQAQKMEAVGQLTGGIAHDFNNLLTVVIGNLDTLQRRLPNDATARIRRAAEHAMEGARRAAELTQRLLAFSRRQPLNPQPVDVNRLVESLSEILRRTLGEHIAVRNRLDADLWSVEVDPIQLEASLLNLAVNARDAMPHGGTVRVETTNVTLHELVRAGMPEPDGVRWVVIQVIDTGKGMTPDELEHAFEPFFTTKEVGHGTGLGLSQVYGFVKQSGGHVELRSIVGVGTTVSIYLPGRAERVTSPDHDRADQHPKAAPAHVLVVEDEPRVREFSTQLLIDLGHEVVSVGDPAAALEHLGRDAPVDLLFTDVGLPGMNGRQLADEARRRRPGLKVLFTSGYAREAIIEQGRIEPGVELITKPFTLDQLATRVAQVLARGDSGGS
jgi:PAS domain S-box-containing protein